ncbi:MAG: VWA domain-containing protein [Anaerolineae bacterium]|nr:VWA domain-containing protein [Anaerolineae bacterium]
MKFLWPSAMFLLGLLPLMTLAYLWTLRRRRRFAVRYSSISLLREALPAQSRLRRHLPFALFLLTLASLSLALARPVAVTLVPAGRATVMLAMDVSHSMRRSDIPPSRLAAAKEAALSFINRQEENNQIGIVAFAGTAHLVQPPTIDTEALETAIQNLTTGRGTAIGSGILTALDTIADLNPNVAASSREAAAEEQVSAVPEGVYMADIIVLLTDGVATTGPPPLEAAQQAMRRGVRVYTIGFGTEDGSSSGQENNFYGSWYRRGIDEETLKEIARITGGEYYAAASAGELQKVFESLPTYLRTREETTEVSVLFAALGAMAIITAVILAQLWQPLP